jgi:tRNA threonylcarbamoyladenosine biosynthesis protein TsaB
LHILVLDTATKRLSLSLIDISAKKSIASYVDKEDENSHARKIILSIQDLLKGAAIDIKQVSAIAVNEGPGSFTGLRVGSSTAKGLCFALDIPLIAYCGLALYANYLFRIKSEEITDVFMLIDARRGNYFYSHAKKNLQSEHADFRHLTDIETEIYLSHKPLVYYLDKENELDLSAKDLTDGVLEKWNKKDFADIRSFEPQYIVNNYISKNDIRPA